MSDDSEKQAKMDFTWDVTEKAPFLTHIQTGYQRRDREGNAWGNGGYTVRTGTGNVGAAGYVAPIVVPTEALTVNYRSCMPTATSTQPCQYGYLPGTTVGANNSPVANLNNTLFGTMTFTPARARRPDLERPLYEGLSVPGGLSGQGRCHDPIGRISIRTSSPRAFPARCSTTTA